MRWNVGAVVIAVLPLLSCSSEDGSSCEPRLEGGKGTVQADGVEREYLLALPDPDVEPPYPVILDFHGRGSNALEQTAYSGVAAAAPARGYVVAVPDADNAADMWMLPPQGDHDLAFADALLDLLEAEACTDPDRAFAAGMSNGGGMAAGLICGLDGRLRGVATVAGINLGRPCASPPPTLLLAFHGTDDGVVPYEGGRHSLAPGLELDSVPTAAERWADRFACNAPSERSVTADASVRRWDRCDGEARVDLYTIRGGGHTWPGSFPVPRLGPTSTATEATAIILDAFDGA